MLANQKPGAALVGYQGASIIWLIATAWIASSHPALSFLAPVAPALPVGLAVLIAATVVAQYRWESMYRVGLALAALALFVGGSRLLSLVMDTDLDLTPAQYWLVLAELALGSAVSLASGLALRRRVTAPTARSAD